MPTKRLSLQERQQRVRQVWNRIERDAPNISRERLMIMTADEANVPYGDVAMLFYGDDPDVPWIALKSSK